MQQIYANTSKIMVDAKGGNNLLYLPLDKLMETVAAPGHAGVPAAQAVESTVNRGVSISNDVPPQLEKNDVRSRDASLRSRDRDGR